MVEELKSFDLNKVDNIFKELNAYYDTKPISNKNNEKIEQLTIELRNKINKIQRKQWLEKICFIIGIILLFIGVAILFWSDLEIHFIYLIRLIVVNVS